MQTTQPGLWSLPSWFPFCALTSLSLKKRKQRNPSCSRSFMLLVCLGRDHYYCKVCVCPREKKSGWERKKIFYNNVSPWVAKATLWLLPEMGTQRLKEGGCYPT